MPSAFDQLKDPHKKAKIIKSAFDSDSFDADGSIHVDGLVGSATISPSGRDVALASPDGLAIIDLDSPYNPPRRLSSHGLPWLVVDVQWSPFARRDYWVASTANHRCLVWNLNLREDSASGAIEHSLEGHSRAITDINFSAQHADILATCAVDGYVHCWDLRKPRQPALSFCDWFAGATQVKFNRQDPHILASSHDRWLHIWDDRKAAEPLKSISAHTSKIYGLDWNRTRTTAVVTCSLDKTIKFWDYERDDDVPERVIRTDFPVWRARHTPFGWGLLAMPQTEPGKLYLFDRRSPPDAPTDGYVDPVAVFPGHGNHKVKEFLWRSRGDIDDGIDNREFQLVSWGSDNELRLERAEGPVLESVGHIKGGPVRKNLIITRKGATYKTFRTVDDGGHHRRTATMSDPRTANSGTPYRQSALTLGMNSPHYHPGLTWKGPSMKAKVTTAKIVDRSQAQMDWMRGVSMNKRKSSTDTSQRAASKDSSMFSPGYHDNQWGEPETIQEEFLRISNQLPNVKWDNIDMDHLTLNASLRGPWGVSGELIFIKVKVDIPHAYPKSKMPKFIIEKNAFMPEETYKKLEHEINQLATQFLKRKQNCLAAAFSYLLGETDLESSTSFFKNVRDLDDDSDGMADESSSEDDENDINVGGSAAMSQELTASAEIDNTLAPTNRPTIPPLYRSCGARFSNDGRLVCFFPTKEEKAKLLFSPSDTLKERPKGEPNFAGFGRLAHDSPPPKHRDLNDDASATEDQSDDSEDSDDSSSSSSSDSELTEMHKVNFWYQPSRRFRKAWSADDSVRSSGGGTGAGTGTGTGTSRRRPGRPKNIISFYDMRSELPSKKQFAQEYAIFGDGADVCEHNAQVAEKYGYYDLVNIWKYSALLLRSDIPLELHQLRQRQKSILVIAKDALSRYRDHTATKDEELLTGRVKWGTHPLAQDFVNDLFDHFERLADVQMLAMLSCIFGEASTEDSVAYAESHLTQPETPLPMKAPSFSLEYFPTETTLWNIHGRSQPSSAITTPRTSQTPVLFSDPQSPEDFGWGGDPGSQSYSTGETPPQRSLRDNLGDLDQIQSLSTSPDNRSFRRSNSAITSTFTASLPRTLTGIVSSSPPAPGRKRPSPAETILSNLTTGNITWGGSTVFGAPTPSEPAGTARTSISDDDYRRDELVSMVPVSVSVRLENEMLFNDDGWMTTPLLEPSRNPMYASYRYAYAEMLQMWGLPLARLEIMKFNVLKEDNMAASMSLGGANTAESSYHESNNLNDSGHTGTGTATGATSPTILLGGKREQLQALQALGRGLDVTGICRIHETQLDSLQYTKPDTTVGGAVGTCEKCKRVQSQLRCVYCQEPIDALYPPCLGCGCASHEHCLTEWHQAGETECPAGDECNCVKEASNGLVESWSAMKAFIERQKLQQATEQNAAGKSGFGKVTGLAGRLRRRSVPGNLRPYEEDDEDAVGGSSRGSLHGGDDDEMDKEDWESVASMPTGSAMISHAKPSPLGPGTLSAARLSIGNRLKKSLGEGGRPSALRRQSGGILPPRKPGL